MSMLRMLMLRMLRAPRYPSIARPRLCKTPSREYSQPVDHDVDVEVNDVDVEDVDVEDVARASVSVDRKAETLQKTVKGVRPTC
jgi:hypothetical protein